MIGAVKLANKILVIILLLIGAYITILPLTPEITFFLHKLDTKELKLKTDVNSILIKDIFVNAQVFEGGNDSLNKGLWRIPYSSTPDKGSNTVIVAHRFLYTDGLNTFYHLDKLEVGDEIYMNWNQEEYKYKIFEISVVNPTDTWIEDSTRDPILTLYTCTPLWTAQKRLAIRAKLIS